MSFIKYPYDKELIKRKIIDIKRDMERLVQPLCSERFFVDWYGAYDIDPKHLVYWICVQSDKLKKKFMENSELMIALRSLLETHDYPAESRGSVYIGFESVETVNRDSKGNWYHHFK